jgi:hypothetical protein
MVKLSSLAGATASNKFTETAQSAFFSQILSGRNFRGEYNQDNAYSRGDVVVVNSSTYGPKLYEAATDIVAKTAFSEKLWTVPAVGSPFFNAGQLILSNSQEYPLNDSTKTITLKREMDNADYIVITRQHDIGVDEVEIYNKTTNSFRIRYWGTSSLVKVNWAVIREN